MKSKSGELLAEIEALGGGREDLELLGDLDDSDASDYEIVEEIVEDGRADKNLISDLKQMLGKIGLDKKSVAEFMDDEDDEEDEEVAVEKTVAKPEKPVASTRASDKPSTKPLDINIASLPKTTANLDLKCTRRDFLFEPNALWFDGIESAETKIEKCETESRREVIDKLLPILKEIGKKLLDHEYFLFSEQKRKKSASEYQWFQTVVKSGTLSDRISALTLAVLDSPLHNVPHVTALLNLAQKKSKRESLMGVEAIKDLLLGQSSQSSGLLPSHRKLKFFQEQPLLHGLIQMLSSQGLLKKIVPGMSLDKVPLVVCQCLASWYFEDYLKTFYYEWILLVDRFSKDTDTHIRTKMISMSWELLSNKPEQERTHLTLLVNKLGDLDRKVASKVGFLLLKLLESHPQMKFAVVKEVDSFMSRSGLSEKAKYYSLIFLNQVQFTKAPYDILTARFSCEVFFQLFESLLEKGKDQKEESVDSKLLAAILTGIARAFTFACMSLPGMQNASAQIGKSFRHIFEESYGDNIEKHLTSLFRVVHLHEKSFATAIQALHVLFIIVFQFNKEEDTYTALSANLSSRFFRAIYSTMDSYRLGDSSKCHGLYLNLIYKSFKSNSDPQSFLACARRLLQSIISGSPSCDSAYTNAALVALSEAYKENELNSIRTMMKDLILNGAEASTSKLGCDDDDDDEEEHFKDIVSEDEEKEKSSTIGEDKEMKKDAPKTATQYDPFNRSPEFSNASKTSPWELVLLAQHYHPTTSLFAKTLLFHGKKAENTTKESNLISYPSDPLVDFTVTRFLDKFVYKNPKTAKDQNEQVRRLNKPISSSSVLHKPLPHDRSKEKPINAKEWRKHDNIPADEEFFAQYFDRRPSTVEKKESIEDAIEDDDLDIDEEEDALEDDEIDNAIMESARGKKIEIGEDIDDDDEDFGFDDDEFADLGEDEEDDQEGPEDDFPTLDDDGEDDDVFEGEEDFDDDEEDEKIQDDDSDGADDMDLLDADDDDLIEDAASDADEEERPRKRKDKNLKGNKEMEKALKEKVKSAKGSQVFASYDDFSHLIHQDPAFNDKFWENEKTVTETPPRKSAQGKNGTKRKFTHSKNDSRTKRRRNK